MSFCIVHCNSTPLDKYSKDLKFGYIIKVQIYDFEFDLELQPDFQLSEIFKRIEELEKRDFVGNIKQMQMSLKRKMMKK